jgi:hypothetical protein
MREIRPSGSEGGVARYFAIPTPIVANRKIFAKFDELLL